MRADAEDQAQGERSPTLGAQSRVGAEQHQSQLVILDQSAGIDHHPPPVGCSLGVGDQQWPAPRGHRLGTQVVEDPAPRDGEQPGDGTIRHTLARPATGCRLDRIAEGVLDQVEAPELPGEHRRQPPPVVSDDLLEGGGL